MQKVFCILVLLFNQARVQEFVRGGDLHAKQITTPNLSIITDYFNRKAFFSMGGGPTPPPPRTRA